MPTETTPAVCSHGSLRRSCEICERDAEIERLRAERDEAIAAARHLKNLVTSPLTEEDKEWARETMSDINLARMPRDLATILRTEARNQRTPPIDYAVAEDGGRMVVHPEPDIAMAELLEEAATALAAKDAELAEAWQRYVDANEARIAALEVQLAERAGGVNEDALRALAQAYDREDAAQRGEPDPWNLDDPGDIGDSDTWVSERLACARAVAEAFLSTRSRTGAVKVKALGDWRRGYCSVLKESGS